MIGRITHVIDSLAIGGAQKLLVTFAHEAQRRSLRCEVICLSSPSGSAVEAELAAAGVTLTYFPARRLLDLGRLRRLAQYFRQSKPDVIQTHLTYANIVGGLAGYGAGIPVAATLHSAGNDRRYSRVRAILESWVLRWLDRVVIAVGGQTEQAHRRRLGNQTMRVVYNAVEEPAGMTESERQAIRGQWLKDPESVILISAGRFSTVKAYDDLIRAFAIVHAANPHTLLLLAGDGVMRADWEELAIELEVSRAVVFLGRRNDVPRLLRASDLYASSSVVEGTPLSVMEAMAAGLPVVATDVGDLHTLLNSECGVLVPPREPERLAAEITRLAADRPGRQRMGERARDFAASHFGCAAWFQELLAIYTEMQETR
ncbi:glycosyltransferase [Longilinea arvoryzae]|uniref:Glycosyltransferase n=1 Tax=Longilinea arvoryzae TaxID=360412 RepID=A0A0S7BJ68_9CHLR|nr:glycosyltransferase [Longilinea arvoryzae]GAP14502.1 glycosyltransferase [Longilinea arvoryzae]